MNWLISFNWFTFMLFIGWFQTKIFISNWFHQKRLLSFSKELNREGGSILRKPFWATIFRFLCIEVFSTQLAKTSKLQWLQDPRMELCLPVPNRKYICLLFCCRSSEYFWRIILKPYLVLMRRERTSWIDSWNIPHQDLLLLKRLYNQCWLRCVCIRCTDRLRLSL